MAGLLLIVAHPDDEFFCSGALAALRRNHVPVTVAYWTRGEGGMGKRRRRFVSLMPSFLNPRVGEIGKSMRALDISDWVFLDYVDPVPNPGMQAPEHDPSVFQTALEKLMDRVKPELVMTHGSDGEYGHPAHVVLHQRVREVLRNRESAPGLLTFSAVRPDGLMKPLQNQSDPADVVLDALPYADQRLKVLMAHSSQKHVWPQFFPEAGDSLEKVIDLSRYEYYHCVNGSDPVSGKRALEIFCGWSGAVVIDGEQ